MKASVIGTGFGAEVVGRVYAELGIEIQVVSPRDEAAVRQACAAPVDLVSIHSPPFLHKQHVLEAISNGRNVLCDKPFGLNPAEAQEMLEAARAAGVLHFLNFEFREEPARAEIKRLIDKGAVGEVLHVRWSMYSSVGRNPETPHGWLFDKTKGGGWIAAYGSHVVDCLHWLVGGIDSASALRRTDVTERPDGSGGMAASTAEDGFSASFRFSNGATASLDTAYSAAITVPQQIVVHGSDGMLDLSGVAHLTLSRPGEEPQQFAFDPPEGDIHLRPFTAWARKVKRAIEEQRQIGPSFEDGLASTRVLDMLQNCSADSPKS